MCFCTNYETYKLIHLNELKFEPEKIIQGKAEIIADHLNHSVFDI